MTNTSKDEGGIWDGKDKLLVKFGTDPESLEEFTVPKGEKKTEKYPDWKSDDIAVWDRISAKGNAYRFIKKGELDYVAFKARNKAFGAADWVIKKSEPLNKT